MINKEAFFKTLIDDDDTYKWRQVLNKDKTEPLYFSKVFQSDYKFVERSNILGLWFERDLSFKTHAAIISA